MVGLDPEFAALADQINNRRIVLPVDWIGVVEVLHKDHIQSLARGLRDGGFVLFEGLERGIGRGDQHAAGIQVGVRGPKSRLEIGPAVHVRDRIVHEHRVEGAPEIERPHVAFEKFALRVQLRRLGQDGGAEIQARDLEIPLQIQDVLAASATDVEQGFHRPPRVAPNQARDVFAVMGILRGGIAPQRPKPGQIGVKTAGVVRRFHNLTRKETGSVAADESKTHDGVQAERKRAEGRGLPPGLIETCAHWSLLEGAWTSPRLSNSVRKGFMGGGKTGPDRRGWKGKLRKNFLSDFSDFQLAESLDVRCKKIRSVFLLASVQLLNRGRTEVSQGSFQPTPKFH